MLLSWLRGKGRTDLVTEFFARVFTNDQDGLRLRRIPLWSKWASQQAASVGAGPHVVLSRQAGWATLERLASLLEAKLDEVAQRRSPAVWCALIRRLQLPIMAMMPMTGEQVLLGASAATAASTRANRLSAFLLAPWWITPGVLTDVDDLLSLCVLLKNARAAQLRIGKGQHLTLGSGLGWQVVSDDHDVEGAINLYDWRMALAG